MTSTNLDVVCMTSDLNDIAMGNPDPVDFREC